MSCHEAEELALGHTHTHTHTHTHAWARQDGAEVQIQVCPRQGPKSLPAALPPLPIVCQQLPISGHLETLQSQHQCPSAQRPCTGRIRPSYPSCYFHFLHWISEFSPFIFRSILKFTCKRSPLIQHLFPQPRLGPPLNAPTGSLLVTPILS